MTKKAKKGTEAASPDKPKERFNTHLSKYNSDLSNKKIPTKARFILNKQRLIRGVDQS